MTMTLVETKTLGTAAASIEFTSIPQDGTDLLVLLSCRGGAGAGNGITLRPNGSTTNGSSRQLYGTGSSVVSNTFSAIAGGIVNGSSETANTFNNSMVYVPNYTSSANKSFSTDAVMENNATQAFQSIVAGLWSNTAAITSLTFVTSDAADFVAGSTISLYKITRGTSNGVVVS